jgi:HAD superfamily hydrolase (TIGR01509 family)
MKYTTYLFDWDGTLLDSLPVWFKIFQDLLAYGDIKLSPIQQRQSYNRWDNMRDFVEISDEKWTDMMDYSRKITTERIKNIPLVSGVAEMLQTLHKSNCRTALITRSYRNLVGPMLEEHGLIGGFDAVVAYEDVKEHKPDPEPLFKAMEELGANPEETVMVGDSETDLLAGKRAKVDTYLFCPPANERYYNKTELLEYEPTELFVSWEEFLKLVE